MESKAEMEWKVTMRQAGMKCMCFKGRDWMDH